MKGSFAVKWNLSSREERGNGWIGRWRKVITLITSLIKSRFKGIDGDAV